jgi:hypothetical protein
LLLWQRLFLAFLDIFLEQQILKYRVFKRSVHTSVRNIHILIEEPEFNVPLRSME